MPAHTKKPQRQEAFIAALMAQPTVTLAAKQAQISEATAQRWLKEPDFAARYAEAKRQAFSEVISYLQASMLGAVATLRQVMLAPETKASTRVQAAGKLLELGLRSYEILTYEERLATVEAALQGRNQ